MKPVIALVASVMIAISIGTPVEATEEFFPIGIFEAGIYARAFRTTCGDHNQACGALNYMALDDLRGDMNGGTSYGYRSGFNVVLEYAYSSEHGSAVDSTDVACLLSQAQNYGFSVALVLPNSTGDDSTLNLFQQTPANLQPALEFVDKFRNHSGIYGWYMADEPATLAIDGAKFGGTMSAARLSAVREACMELDDTRPYLIALPDYDAHQFNRSPWPTFPQTGPYAGWDAAHADWRWNNPGSDTLCFSDPDESIADEVCLTQDYTVAADVILEDSYTSDLELWTKRLKAIDDLVYTKPGQSHIVIGIDRNSSTGHRTPLDVLRYQSYTGIIHGASGLWFYSYYGTFDNRDGCISNEYVRYGQANSYFTDTLSVMSNELDSLDVFLTGAELSRYAWDDTTGFDLGVIDEEGNAEPRIHCTLRKWEGQVLLIAANVSSATVQASFDFTGLPLTADTEVLLEAIAASRIFGNAGETATVEIVDGGFSDEFGPYMTRLYRFRQRLVPQDFTLVSDAISNSVPGDVIRITSPMTIEALSLPAGVFLRADVPNVVIDADGSSVGVTLVEADAPGSGVSGITIRNFDDYGIRVESGGSESVLIRDCTIEILDNAPSAGIFLDGTPAIVSECDISGPGVANGINVQGGPATVSECSITVPSGLGIYVNSFYTVGIIGNTITNAQTGIYVFHIGDGSPIHQNLVTNCGYMGINTQSELPSILYNNSWGPIQQGYHHAGGNGVPGSNLSLDPRLCSGALTLNASSPCIPANNAWDVWIGSVHEVTCMSGTLNTSLSDADLVLDEVNVPNMRLDLTSDFKVSGGKTVTIDAGMLVSADQGDEANLGVNGTEDEIIMDDGRFIVQGTSTAKAVFRSAATSPVAGDWGGFYVKNGGDLKLTYADVSHATYGILAVGLADTVSLANTNIDSCQQVVIQVNNRCTSTLPEVCTATRLLVSGSKIWTNGATHGILTYFPLEVSVVGDTITGSAATFYGIYADTMGSGATDAEIKNCKITGLTAGTGIYVNHGSPALKGSLVKDCKWGIQLRGPGTPVVQRATVSGLGTRLDHCSTGLYVQSASASVDSVSVEPGGLSGAICVSSAGASGGTYTKLKLLGGTVGFVASSTASPAPTLRNSQILGFTINGTKHEGTGGLDLGTVASVGNNWIESSSASGKWVLVKTCPSGGATLPARYNYWGGDPISSKFSACVDYSNWLSSQQSALIIQHAGVATSPRPFVATPNPFTGGVSFSFSVGTEGATSVRLKLFDLAGRLVRTVAEAEMTPGEHELAWDGRDDAGVVVGSGIYFARFQVGSELTTVKVIKLP